MLRVLAMHNQNVRDIKDGILICEILSFFVLFFHDSTQFENLLCKNVRKSNLEMHFENGMVENNAQRSMGRSNNDSSRCVGRNDGSCCWCL